jgi:hypothetical protein
MASALEFSSNAFGILHFIARDIHRMLSLQNSAAILP